MSELSKQALKVDNNQSFPNNNNGAITPSILRAFNVNMIDSLVDEIGYAADSSSWNQQIDTLEQFTASAAAITASSLVTASFDNGTRNLTFTKGNGTTFAVNIPDVSGSTGNFATTGSNTFTGNQNISGSIVFPNGTEIRGNAGQSTVITSSTNLRIESDVSMGIQAGMGNLNISGSNVFLQNLRYPNQDGTAGQVVSTDGNGILTFTTPSATINTGSLVTTSSFNAYTQSNDQRVTALELASASLFTSASLALTTASVAGNVLTFTKGDRTTFNLTVDTGSGGGGGGTTYINPTLNPYSGSLILVANTFTSSSFGHISVSANGQVNLIFKDNNLTGDTILSGSNNIFTNPTAPSAGRANYIGGSSNLFLNSQSDQLPQITSSAASVSGARPVMNANIINGTHAWTINQAPNPGTHTYSNNIIAGATGQWNFNMTGNTGTVNVNHNFGLSSNMTLNSPSRSVAEINAGASGSNALTIQNNTIVGTFNYNGPVSSSTHTIGQNNIAGTVTFNVQSQSRAITSNANIINGILTYTDNTVFAPTLLSNPAISNNNINGTTTLTLAGSSSFSVLNNNLNTVTVTSFLDASAVTNTGQRTSTLNANAIFGNNNSILFSGSIGAAPTGRTLSTNLIAGQFISASLIGDGSGSNMFATAILGGGLNVIGTTTIAAAGLQQNYGSAFFGRWNAEDGNRARTAPTILAIGTGTSGSAGIVRKTGFLIDSGSNTFFEGTLNVSGSTTLSGSLYIQSASAFPSQIGTSLVTWNSATGQVGQATTSTLISSSFSAGEFYSMTTLSGSSGVSASINLPNTAISNGVSIQNNSQIVVQNTGTYNIQFSAQCDAFDNADTIWIWFKKNGTNITDSASKLIMQNNTAAIMTVNIFDNAVPNDYYEVVWQNNAGHGRLTSDAATGNIPGVPSVIVTVNQVK